MTQTALARWQALLGADHVDDPQAAQLRYGACTTGAARGPRCDRGTTLWHVVRECGGHLDMGVWNGRSLGTGGATSIYVRCGSRRGNLRLRAAATRRGVLRE